MARRACPARCTAYLPHSLRTSLAAQLGTDRDTQLQALRPGAVAPSRSGAVILTGNCQRAPGVHTRVSVRPGHTCPWRRPGQPQQPSQAPAQFQVSAYERPQAWLEPLGLSANTRPGGRQIPNLDQMPPEAVWQAC